MSEVSHLSLCAYIIVAYSISTYQINVLSATALLQHGRITLTSCGGLSAPAYTRHLLNFSQPFILLYDLVNSRPHAITAPRRGYRHPRRARPLFHTPRSLLPPLRYHYTELGSGPQDPGRPGVTNPDRRRARREKEQGNAAVVASYWS